MLQSVQSVKIDEALDAYKKHTRRDENNKLTPQCSLSPVKPESFSYETGSSDKLFTSGIEHIANGYAAVVILAGGQGTRLGYLGPKVEIDIGLPSSKSLFQLHLEKIRRVMHLAASAASKKETLTMEKVRLPVYIMTSSAVHDETLSFLSRNNFFGLREDIMLFQQAETPCIDLEGNLMLHSRCELAKAPNGNGGIFHALCRSGALHDMQDRGIHAVHVCSIDNALAPTVGPELIAHCIDNSLQACEKVTPKERADEPVGVFARDASNALCVVEYSELPEGQAHARDDTSGELRFNAANIAMHAFSLCFLHHCVDTEAACKLHLAKKKVPFVNDDGSSTVQPDETNAYKHIRHPVSFACSEKLKDALLRWSKHLPPTGSEEHQQQQLLLGGCSAADVRSILQASFGASDALSRIRTSFACSCLCNGRSINDVAHLLGFSTAHVECLSDALAQA
jgi:UDP-N-acetylglucosamine/UDP-N-acetylgalactosamine diphosphorylase